MLSRLHARRLAWTASVVVATGRWNLLLLPHVLELVDSGLARHIFATLGSLVAHTGVFLSSAMNVAQTLSLPLQIASLLLHKLIVVIFLHGGILLILSIVAAL